MAAKRDTGVRPSRNGKRGYWEVRIACGPDPRRPGKYLEQAKTIGPCSQRDAAKERAEWQREYDMRSGNTEGREVTFGELLDAALDALEQAGREYNTLKGYRGNADVWLRPTLGDILITQLTSRDLDRVYAKMRKAGRSAGTIAQVNAFARKALNIAIVWGWIVANPTKGTHRPTPRRGRVAPPTVEQLMKLVRTAAGEDEAMAILFEVASGVGGRRGELCGLLWRDLDWDESRIFVHQAAKQLRKAEGGVRVADTKTHQHRNVDLPAFVLEVLRHHRALLEERAALHGTTLAPNAFIFSREPDCSQPLWPDWVTAAFERAREHAGLDEVRAAHGLRPVRLQDLRHLYATLQLAKGVPVEVVAQLLGHAKISTTHDFYAHAMPGAGKAAVKVLDELLGRRNGGGASLPAAPVAELVELPEVLEVAASIVATPVVTLPVSPPVSTAPAAILGVAAPAEGAPRGKTAALAVLGDLERGVWVTAVEVVAEMVERGWCVEPGRMDTSIRTALNRLERDGRARKRKRNAKETEYRPTG